MTEPRSRYEERRARIRRRLLVLWSVLLGGLPGSVSFLFLDLKLGDLDTQWRWGMIGLCVVPFFIMLWEHLGDEMTTRAERKQKTLVALACGLAGAFIGRCLVFAWLMFWPVIVPALRSIHLID